MELTSERVEGALVELQAAFERRDMVRQVLLVRQYMSLGLRDAKNYVDQNRGNLAQFRKDFEGCAGLTNEGPKERVFEQPNFRFVMRRTDLTTEQVQKFFDDTMAELLAKRS